MSEERTGNESENRKKSVFEPKRNRVALETLSTMVTDLYSLFSDSIIAGDDDVDVNMTWQMPKWRTGAICNIYNLFLLVRKPFNEILHTFTACEHCG